MTCEERSCTSYVSIMEAVHTGNMRRIVYIFGKLLSDFICCTQSLLLSLELIIPSNVYKNVHG